MNNDFKGKNDPVFVHQSEMKDEDGSVLREPATSPYGSFY